METRKLGNSNLEVPALGLGCMCMSWSYHQARQDMPDSIVSLKRSGYSSTLRQRGLAQYRAAVLEFDRLWESGRSRGQPERMKRLLVLIEQSEEESAPDRADLALPRRKQWGHS
jgi:hypothetical protein